MSLTSPQKPTRFAIFAPVRLQSLLRQRLQALDKALCCRRPGIGAAAGGTVGILTGLGLLAIPGVGPVVAAGWLVATLAGAAAGGATGGVIGALTQAGVSTDEADAYAETAPRSR